MHLSKAKLKVVRMGLRFALDGSPVRIVAFHVLNAVPFYHLIMQLMRPWARKELKDLVNVASKKPLNFFKFLVF